MKTQTLQVKNLTTDGEEKGVFEAYGNVKFVLDKVRDCAVDGVYKSSILKAQQTGKLPKMLLQHDHKQVCGVWLEMDEDDKGLRLKGQLALNTTIGRETYELIKMGALDSLSIGYVVKEEKYDSVSKVNYLIDIDLKEISIVTFACNEASLIDSVKSTPDDVNTSPNTPLEAPVEVFVDTTDETEATPQNTPEVVPETIDNGIELKCLALALNLLSLKLMLHKNQIKMSK